MLLGPFRLGRYVVAEYVRICILVFRVVCGMYFAVQARLDSMLARLLPTTAKSDTVKLTMFEKKVVLPLLRYCTIPSHIAFIMDGNRRFARAQNQASVTGHRMGYERLQRVLLWCFELDVKEVSVYAFSVDNFSRSPEEVNYLMDLAEAKLESLCEEGGFVMTHNIKVRICGDKSLLRPSLFEVVQRIEAKTALHTGGTFNILLAYSSKREVNQAVERTLQQIPAKEVTWDAIESNLYSSTPPDLIVRTSGETRLSDFLIWQIQPLKTVVVFEHHFWPEFSLADLGKSLLRYHNRTYYRT